ncbi:LLM class flavin-dependent oxidoreductase [Actinomadura sp. NTSP31]|uniref:LLM class flavin-dependent oxidoreductase n=1 Tax=Actinomadura sp. NTSP31 TaxID=1735447 RepID=UPI0035BF5E83
MVDQILVLELGGRLARGWSADVPGAGPPPVLVAAMSPAMLRGAGELAGGTVTWPPGSRTIADHIRPALDETAAGRPAPAVVASLPVCLTDDPAAARDRAAAAFDFWESGRR